VEIKLRKVGGNLEIEINSLQVFGKLSSVKLQKMNLETFQATEKFLENEIVNFLCWLPPILEQKRMSTNVPMAGVESIST
jgi:hypothetical protein